MSDPNLSCYTRPEGRRPVLVMEGTLDMATAPGAAEALREFQAAHGPHIVLDLSRLDFIDSRGVGVLLGAARAACDAGGGLYLPSPATPVRKILEMCGLTSLFPAAPPLPTAATGGGNSPPAAPARPAKSAAPRTAAGRPLKRAA